MAASTVVAELSQPSKSVRPVPHDSAQLRSVGNVVGFEPSGGFASGVYEPRSSVPFSHSRYVVAAPVQIVLPASHSNVVIPDAVLAAIWAGVK
jgi:hypothetical protein